MTRTRPFFRCAARPEPFFAFSVETPALTATLLDEAYDMLRSFDAVLGPTSAGGWYVLGLREPSHAADLRMLPDSTALALAALRRGLRVAMLPVLPEEISGPAGNLSRPDEH
ncbi:DUF2064 domain-containing protein [Actinoplanes sp. NPDC051859]|uniref:DUF2064 domain-containing protein n=1 Tax=Actinoplanes sp. NPDC051859 TaxID=3363909 RepID=UPI0037BCABED